nr:hypothetical protein [uncultured Flavobacterium sp.]
MKKTVIVFILMLSLISCSNDSDDSKSKVAIDYYGKWTLVKMSGSIPNSETTGSKMDWQESYVFNTDGTFTKIRLRDNITTKSSGTFVIQKEDDYISFSLKHSKNNEIIGNCSGGDLSEFLSINKENLLQSSWSACDGPGLFYDKMK